MQKIYCSRHKEKTYIKINVNGALTKRYSNYGQTYRMELSVKTDNSLKLLTIFTKNSIPNAYPASEYASDLAINSKIKSK